jgi:8-oxo-dGTP diphosphatase
MQLSDIDRSSWTPAEHATLLFVIQDNRILLIHKKRGLGAGKINGPGGRIEPDETPRECAIRETREELLITPVNVAYAGRLNFQFLDGFSIRGEVFRASGYHGTPSETDEAVPLWQPVDALPFENMWADDPIWMPLMLSGEQFDGWFIFENERLVEHDVRIA